ncbi:MAG: VTT domain-containing protein [Alphaproteobacteria bacterium]|jgi:membrane protein YqaA with SNARE-associated domain
MLSHAATLSTMAFAAFTAATILPGGSEVVFVSFLATGYEAPLALFVVATVFNTLGGMTNWWIGTLIAKGAETEKGHAWLERFKLPPDMMTRVHDLFERFGWWALLFSWMPMIGDPITIVAGMARHPPIPTAILTGIGKGLRFAALWAGTAGVLRYYFPH